MSKDKKIKSENALVSIFRHNWGILAALAVLFIIFLCNITYFSEGKQSE